MNEECRRFSDLIDRTDPKSIEERESHWADCCTCAVKLEEWNSLSLMARELRVEWESPALWSRIERGLTGQRKDARSTLRGRRSASSLMQVAAMLVVVLGLGTILVRGLRLESPSDGNRERWREWVLRESVIEEVERNEAQHLASIERLETLVGPGLEHPETPLLMNYREKLVLLDEGIEDCRDQIDQNRYNAHLRRQLLAMYSEKDRTLRDVLEETE